MKRVIDGKVFDMTAEEITERNADVEKSKIEREKEEANFTNRENLKKSGKAKLKAGEPLTDDEISVLFPDESVG